MSMPSLFLNGARGSQIARRDGGDVGVFLVQRVIRDRRLHAVEGLFWSELEGQVEVVQHAPTCRVDAKERRLVSAGLDFDEQRRRLFL
jgi:hypothetical protein